MKIYINFQSWKLLKDRYLDIIILYFFFLKIVKLNLAIGFADNKGMVDCIWLYAWKGVKRRME